MRKAFFLGPSPYILETHFALKLKIFTGTGIIYWQFSFVTSERCENDVIAPSMGEIL